MNSPSASSIPSAGVSRRSVLKVGAGVASLALLPGALISACSSSKSGGGGSASGTTSIGSNYSDANVKSAFAAVIAGYSKASQVSANTVDHNSFQNNIQNYLQGTPNDVFCWFAGYRARFFAAQNLLSPIDDVWNTIGAKFSDSIKAASKGDDGHLYLVPWVNYPWVMFYKKSVFAAKGYTVPGTWDALIALCKQMQKDGFKTPIAIGQKDGWPAMGTFDILNMRINGYQFHVDLMAGKEAWDGAQAKAVFKQWAELLPYYSQGALGLTWQEGATQVENKQAGMFLLGGFVVSNFKKANQGDVDFFPFPAINSKWGQDSIDAPIDGYMLSKKPKNLAGAKKLIGYFGTAQAINIYNPLNPGNLAVNIHANKSYYSPLQKKEAALIASTKHIAQYMDRDTRPDFATTVMIPSLQSFLNNPSDINGLVKSIQKQKKAIFGS